MTNDAILLKISIMINFSWRLKWLQGPLRQGHGHQNDDAKYQV